MIRTRGPGRGPAKTRRSHVLIAGAALLVGGAALLGAGEPSASPPAQIPGAALDTPTSAGARAALGTTRSISVADVAVDLDRVIRDGDVYTVKLADGRRAVLTLDPALQELAEKLLNESRAPRGAIVVMHPDGRILALAGRKTEEPKGSREGTFDWRLATEVWAPSASVFKLVTASALVRAGVDPAAAVCYHGGLRSVLEHNLRDDKRDSRCESLAYGVAHSQNAILGKLAFQKLDPKLLEAEARALGWLDAVPLVKSRAQGELTLPPDHDLEFARAAAGFKGARLSVMGGALLSATFAADGLQPQPRLVASIDGTPVAAPKPRRAIDAGAARAVAKMMVGTCDGGSAVKSFGQVARGGLSVAGKTGTLTVNDPFYIEHSWFVGFAPADKPEVVVSVLLGNPESWHLRGHEAARRLIERALRPAKRREKDPS
ncbi:MAG: penicillin-binding transpeptidase domain-containing protein [Kofleriaceae bacterium]